ncbi:DUF4325 domain-containing protein [Celeribacter baekdonensis]|uniref:STAS-like domain-containing protein n=1 Tax=Celeribacter baekdonensis TaxID=875171 RepID=UPI0030DCC61D
MDKMIRIAEDFSEYPGGRYPEDGDGNGTDFRENFLVPVIASGDHAKIVLDGTKGYPSSFLEEAFGGLVRGGYEAQKIKDTFSFVANQPGFARFIALINEHIDRAARYQKIAKV